MATSSPTNLLLDNECRFDRPFSIKNRCNDFLIHFSSLDWISLSYKCNFVYKTKTFKTADSAINYEKALLFGDIRLAKAIQKSRPEESSVLIQTLNFNKQIWEEKARGIVYNVMEAKFVGDVAVKLSESNNAYLGFYDNDPYLKTSLDGLDWQFPFDIRNITDFSKPLYETFPFLRGEPYEKELWEGTPFEFNGNLLGDILMELRFVRKQELFKSKNKVFYREHYADSEHNAVEFFKTIDLNSFRNK
jgi:hypothetical protein